MGAYVCFGDVSTTSGEEIAQKCCASSPDASPPRAVFQYTNVAEYSDVLGLFDTAMQTYGRIDHAVAGAGIGETGNPFDPALTMESVREVGSFFLSQNTVYANESCSRCHLQKP